MSRPLTSPEGESQGLCRVGQAGGVLSGSLADKAEDILRRHSKGAPMHYRRLTEIGVAEGVIVPGGPTPEASLNSAVTQDIKNRSRTGGVQRFRSHGRGLFSLHRPSDPLRGAVDRKNKECASASVRYSVKRTLKRSSS